MKTVMKQTKRILAVMLALALVVLAVPDTALLAGEVSTEPNAVEESVAPSEGMEEPAATPEETEEEEEETEEPQNESEEEVPSAPAEETAEESEVVTLTNASTGEAINESRSALGAESSRSIIFSGTNWEAEPSGGISLNKKWIEDANIVFKAVPAKGYEVTLNEEEAPEITVKSGTDVLGATVDESSSFATDGAYDVSVEGSAIAGQSGNITITVKTAKKTFVPTTSPEIDSATGIAGEILLFGPLVDNDENTGDEVHVYAMKPATYGTSYNFTAKLTPVAKAAGMEIKSVSYTIGEGASKPLTVSSTGSYTIPAEEVTGAIAIAVETAVKQLDVNISGTGYLGGATLAVGGEGASKATYGEDLTITFPEESIKAGYELKGIKAYTTSSKTSSVQIPADCINIEGIEEGVVVINGDKVKTNLWVVVTTGYKTVTVSELDDDEKYVIETVSGLEYDEDHYEATFNTDAKFKVTAQDGYVVTSVGYQVTGGSVNELTPVSGVYTIPKSAFTDNVTVVITAEASEEVEMPVTVGADEFTALFVQDVKWKLASKSTYAALTEDKTDLVTPGTLIDVKVTTDGAVTGSLTAKIGDEVQKTYSGPKKVTGKDLYETVYRFQVTGDRADAGLSITGKAAYTYKINLGENSAAIKGGKVDILQGEDLVKIASLGNGGTVNVEAGKKITLSYALVNDNFTVDKVQVGSLDTEPGVEGLVVTAILSEAAAAGANVTVTNKILTEEVAIQNNTNGISQVKFASDNTQTKASASYAAATGTNKKWVTGSGSDYLIYNMADQAVLTLKAATGYLPTATVGGEALVFGKPSSTGVYTYAFTGDSDTTLTELKAEGKIVIGEEEDTETLTIVDYDGCVGSVTVDGKATVADEIEIRKGATVSVKIAPAENCKLIKATKKVGTAAATSLSCSATGLTASIKMGDDAQVITVYSEPIFAIEQLSIGGKELNGGTSFTYKNLPYDTAITYAASYGTEDVTSLVDIELTATDKKDLEETTMSAGTLKIGRADAGRTIKAKVTYEDGDEEFSKTYTFTSVKALTKIAVAGVDANKGTLTQMIGTTKTYAITSKVSGANLDGLAFEGVADENLVATLSEDHKTLTVTVLSEVADHAEFVLTDGENEVDGGEFVLRTENPAIETTKTAPTVSLAGATDVALNLKLALPKDVANMYKVRNGKIYYIVAPTDVEQLGSNPVTAGDPVAIEATGTSQTSLVKVLDGDTGAGGAAKVDFVVLLAQDQTGTMTKEAVIGAAEAGDIPVTKVESAIFDSTAVKTKFQTKDPAYAAKLTLQKKTNVLYTGDTYQDASMKKLLNADGDLVLAVVKGDSFATVNSYTATSFTVYDQITSNPEAVEDPGYKEIHPVVNEAGELVITKADLAALAGYRVWDPVARGETALKKTIYVWSNTRSSDQKATGSFELTIIPRVAGDTNPFFLSPNDPTLTHKAGTTLTTTVTPEFYETLSKNNSLIWSVDTASASNGVTVKNGKVTIPKGYMGNVTVKAASAYSTDGAATPTYSVSATTTIQQKPTAVEASSVVFGYLDDDEEPTTLTVVAENNVGVTVTKLLVEEDEEAGIVDPGFYTIKKGAIATTKKVGDDVVKQYEYDGVVDPDDDTIVTYESGNTKVLDVYSNSIENIYKVGSVPVTATLQDSGSKVKMTLKIENKKLDTDKATTYKEFATVMGSNEGEDVLASNAQLLEDEEFSEDLYNKKLKANAATLTTKSTFVPGLGQIAPLTIGKVSANEDESDFEVTELDDVYGLTMTAVSGAKIFKGNDNFYGATVEDTAESQLHGEYAVIVEAPVFKVKVGSTTYTVTDTAMEGVEAQDTKSTMSTITYGGVYQELELIKTRTADKTKNFNGEIESVVFTALPTTTKAVDIELAESLTTSFVDAERNIEASTGKLVLKKDVYDSPMAGLGTRVPVGTYKLLVTYLDDEGAPVTKAQPVSVKITKAPAYKMTTAYTTSYQYDGDFSMDPVLLTGKTDPDTYGGNISAVSLENINTKGIYNNFAEIFTVSEGEDGWEITLNGDLGEATAADLTGNVVFMVNETEFQRTKVTLTLMTDPGSFAMLADQWVALHSTGWNNKNTTLKSVVTEMKKDMLVPANLTIGSAVAGTLETYNNDTITVVAGNKYKTYDDYCSNDVYPTFFCQKPTGTTKSTDPSEGHLYGVMKITTNKEVNGYVAKDSEYTTFHMEMDPLE